MSCCAKCEKEKLVGTCSPCAQAEQTQQQGVGQGSHGGSGGGHSTSGSGSHGGSGGGHSGGGSIHTPPPPAAGHGSGHTPPAVGSRWWDGSRWYGWNGIAWIVVPVCPAGYVFDTAGNCVKEPPRMMQGTGLNPQPLPPEHPEHYLNPQPSPQKKDTGIIFVGGDHPAVHSEVPPNQGKKIGVGQPYGSNGRTAPTEAKNQTYTYPAAIPSGFQLLGSYRWISATGTLQASNAAVAALPASVYQAAAALAPHGGGSVVSAGYTLQVVSYWANETGAQATVNVYAPFASSFAVPGYVSLLVGQVPDVVVLALQLTKATSVYPGGTLADANWATVTTTDGRTFGAIVPVNNANPSLFYQKLTPTPHTRSTNQGMGQPPGAQFLGYYTYTIPGGSFTASSAALASGGPPAVAVALAQGYWNAWNAGNTNPPMTAQTATQFFQLSNLATNGRSPVNQSLRVNVYQLAAPTTFQAPNLGFSWQLMSEALVPSQVLLALATQTPSTVLALAPNGWTQITTTDGRTFGAIVSQQRNVLACYQWRKPVLANVYAPQRVQGIGQCNGCSQGLPCTASCTSPNCGKCTQALPCTVACSACTPRDYSDRDPVGLGQLATTTPTPATTPWGSIALVSLASLAVGAGVAYVVKNHTELMR